MYCLFYLVVCSISSCSAGTQCSGRGDCAPGTSVCMCDAGWTGADCSMALCSYTDCVAGGGSCDDTTQRCVCPAGKTGQDCSSSTHGPVWEKVVTSSAAGLNWAQQARASHSLVVHQSEFFVFGGFPLNHALFYQFEHFLKFSPTTKQWSPVVVRSSVSPSLRFQHTAVVYQVGHVST